MIFYCVLMKEDSFSRFLKFIVSSVEIWALNTFLWLKRIMQVLTHFALIFVIYILQVMT